MLQKLHGRRTVVAPANVWFRTRDVRQLDRPSLPRSYWTPFRVYFGVLPVVYIPQMYVSLRAIERRPWPPLARIPMSNRSFALPLAPRARRGVFAEDTPYGMSYFAQSRRGVELERIKVRNYETLDDVLFYLAELLELMDPEEAPAPPALTVIPGGRSVSAPVASRPPDVRLVF